MREFTVRTKRWQTPLLMDWKSSTKKKEKKRKDELVFVFVEWNVLLRLREKWERETLWLRGGAKGVVPESFGPLVSNAVEVAPPWWRSVLELFVTIIAVVFPQRHLSQSPTSTIFEWIVSIGYSLANSPLYIICLLILD